MKLRYFWLLLVFVPWLAFAGTFQEGVHYEVMANPQPTETGDKIEVRELFWYGCPHCFKLEPSAEHWLENIPAGVEFVRQPAIFNKNGKLYRSCAKGRYTQVCSHFFGCLMI